MADLNGKFLIRKPALVPLFFVLIFLLVSWVFIALRQPVGSAFLKLLIRTEEAPLPGSFAKKTANPKKTKAEAYHLTLAGASKANSKAGTVLLNKAWNGKAPVAEEAESASGFIADSCLKNWAVLGPVPLKDGLKTPLSSPVFGVPDEELSCETVRTEEWGNRIFTDPKGVLDLRKLLPGGSRPPAGPSAFCLMLTLQITKAEPRAHILVSYDGLLRVQLDGREIHSSASTQKFKSEKPAAIPVELTEGTHSLLLKSFTMGNGRLLRIRLTGQDDSPLFFTETEEMSK